MITILFVCSGNTCRSPMAQALFVKYIQNHSDIYNPRDYVVLSAGIFAADGSSASREAREAIAGEQIDLSKHRSRRLTEEMVRQADYILTMSDSQREYLQQKYSYKENIFNIKIFGTNIPGDIQDPFGAGLEAYYNCLQELKQLMPEVVKRINSAADTGGMYMQVVIGSDHAGVSLKNDIIEFLRQEGYDVLNCGTDSSDSVDYPDIAEKVARQVLHLSVPGILICGTGIGISIAANKIAGIRAAVCTNNYTARLAREHNDANVLALGARVTGSGMALDIVKTFLQSEFQGGRHQRRVDKIHSLEEKFSERSW